MRTPYEGRGGGGGTTANNAIVRTVIIYYVYIREKQSIRHFKAEEMKI